MSKPHIELLIENESGQDVVAYPFIEADHVTLSNGMGINEMLDQDVSMPTVTHDTTAIKVGVGDSDVSSSVVDSAVNMTIKGETYQNILPDPTLRNEMQGKSMQRLNEGYDSIETVDGVSKSAILKGQTLVNGLSNPKATQGGEYVTTISPTHLVINHGENTLGKRVSVDYEWLGGKMRDGADYTLDIWILKNTMRRKDDPTAKIGKINFNNYDIGFYSILPNTVGHITHEVTTSSTNTGVKPYIETFTTCEGELEIQIVIREGKNLIPIEQHFEGMASCKMPVLMTTGKNLFNNEFTTISNYDNQTYSRVNVNKIIGKNGNFTISVLEELNSKGKIWFNLYINGTEKFNLIVNGATVNKKYTFLLNEQNQVEFGVYSEGISKQQALENIKNNFKIQLEEGSTATPYEPHKSNTLSCQLAPLNQTMFEQGTFAETTPPNTQSYESIKLGSEHLYTTRIRTKSTYKVVRGATYEVQLNEGYGIYICYCKNGLYSATINRWLDGTRFTFTVPNDCDEMFFAIRKTDNTVISPSDYPLIGLKIHQEVVLRSLPNSVRDTLNLNTGEYVQRIGETILTEVAGLSNGSFITETHETYIQSISGVVNPNTMICDKLPVNGYPYSAENVECICINSAGNQIAVRVAKSRYASYGSFNEYLAENPITIQYELATPVVRTVDLSSSGNWEKIVLDGSENWTYESPYLRFYTPVPNMVKTNNYLGKLFCDNPNFILTTNYSGMKDLGEMVLTGYNDANNSYPNENWIYITVKSATDVGKLKQYLQQNPITLWYQTATTLDSTQVKQPIFFKDGHIQLSSGVDNSLIPTLDYQAKTSNSYVMDLMKPNTKYTMKAKSANGTFTIDGTSYNVGTNTTFTSPSSMTNKFLVMSNKTNEEVMILEGDVVSKAIPYFKGIKSAFEDESKIEVLSTGSNLFDGDNGMELGAWDTDGKPVNAPNEIRCKNNYTPFPKGLKNGDKMYIVLSDTSINCNTNMHVYDKNKVRINTTQEFRVTNFVNGIATITVNDVSKCRYFSFRAVSTNKECKFAIMLDISNTNIESYKSNTTKIPLLSPLKSLPNGVCDEIILDRENNKAQIIQRVGSIVLDGSDSEEWHFAESNRPDTNTHYVVCANSKVFGERLGKLYSDVSHGVKAFFQDKFAEQAITVWRENGMEMFALHLQDPTHFRVLQVKILKNRLHSTTIEAFREWLSLNPITVYYELATPIITEVDLEGFPYIYKDGHIFLNSDIAPTTQITYSINQAQQIESANENLQRHEKEISHLQKLIAQYIQVEYESTLLSLKI